MKSLFAQSSSDSHHVQRVRLFTVLASVLAVAALAALLLLSKHDPSAAMPGGSVEVKPVSVRVLTVSKEARAEKLVLVGTVQAIHDVQVVSETQGRVVGVFAALGANVREGQVLATVDAVLKESAFKSAQSAFEKAKRDMERFTTLHAEKNLSDNDLENARLTLTNAEAQLVTAKRHLDDATIKAPISGILTERLLEKGAMMQPGQVVGTIVDLSSLKIRVNVPEHDAFGLRVGAPVLVRTDVYAQTTFAGRITAIGSKADAAHSYPVEIVLPNSSSHPLKAGQSAQVEFATQPAAVLALPRTALAGTAERPVVYVLSGTTATRRTVGLGREYGTSVEITNGLQEGETVIISGQQNLRDGAAVSVAK